MNFVARQHELMQRLQWGPTRGPRRQAVLDELRALVREELERELATQRDAGDAGTPRPMTGFLATLDDEQRAFALSGQEPELSSSHQRQRRPYYWLDQDDEEARP